MTDNQDLYAEIAKRRSALQEDIDKAYAVIEEQKAIITARRESLSKLPRPPIQRKKAKQAELPDGTTITEITPPDDINGIF